MAWRTKDGQQSEERPDRRGTEPGWGRRQRTGINNHAANMAEHAARRFESEERRRYTRENGPGWLLFADDDD